METVTHSTAPTLDQLSKLCFTSASYLYNAGQQVRNRGLKLLLKTYAQQRLQFAQVIQDQLGTATSAPTLEQTSAPLDQGWTNLQAGLIIKRRERQRLVIRDALRHEGELIQQYESLLQQELPSPLAAILQKQLNILQTERSRLAALTAEQFDHKLFVRLFDQEEKAEQVVQQLAEAGITPNDMDLVSIERFSIFSQEPDESRRARRATIWTGVLLGAGIGALLGLLPGLAHSQLFPEMGALFGDSRTEIVVEWVVGAALIGMFFAFIFSLFIAQDTVEDDAYVYDESLENGNTLLAVFAAPYNHARVERIIGLKHEFEVQPLPA